MESDDKPNWPPLIGYVDFGIVWRVPARFMNNIYLINPRSYFCPTYFYDGKDPYPKYYMHGAGYFMPWWAVPCIYQENFQVIFVRKDYLSQLSQFVIDKFTKDYSYLQVYLQKMQKRHII